MNAIPAPVHEDACPSPAVAQDDAFDNSYAWVGYESAQPLSFSTADRAAWGALSACVVSSRNPPG